MVNFCIKRPIFSTVLALLFIVAGGICMLVLPIAQYPEIAPPQVQVVTNYTGGSASVVSDTVTQPLEEQINSTPGIIYSKSTSTSNGVSTITVTFEVGYDTSIGAVDVLSRSNIAQPQLPPEAQKTGVTITKQSPSLAMAINLISPKGTYDMVTLSNYVSINIKDEIYRIPGVGQLTIFGERKYAMRVWIDPEKLAGLNMVAGDVIRIIEDQNRQAAAGQIGGMPIGPEQQYQLQVNVQGRLEMKQQFENMVVRAGDDGQIVRIKDIGRVELGAESYTSNATLDGMPSVALGVYQEPGANALELAAAIEAKMQELTKFFPEDIEYRVVYDTTVFVDESVKEVALTLFEALVIVFLVVYIFLQSMRTTFIPAVTIPVSLIGTFTLMAVLGFSINMLSMLGLVLAIGIVVDDAIVVVENVKRQMELDPNLSGREAARKAMKEVVAPIIATSLVLMAVFVPVGFVPGISGRLYNQFALTIACSVLISTINSLTLSPALCALLLKPKAEIEAAQTRRERDGLIRSIISKLVHYHDRFFDWFNRWFDWGNHKYKGWLSWLVPRSRSIVVAFIVMIVATGWLFNKVPGSFVPEEDQGYFVTMVSTPNATSLIRTTQSTEKAAAIIRKMPGVAHTFAVSGLDMSSGAMNSNMGTVFAILDPWSKRETPETQIGALIEEAARLCNSELTDARVTAFNAPAIQGLGAMGGFEFQIQDVASLGYDKLEEVSERFIEVAEKRPELAGLSTTFTSDVPQLYFDLDRNKALSLGVNVDDVTRTLQVNLGSFYVNQFNKFGRVYRVYLQAGESSRTKPSDIKDLYVRNNKGRMIPLSALGEVSRTFGPQNVMHYNLYTSALLNGRAAKGYSSGQASKAMEEVAEEVLYPAGMRYEWTGLVYQQIEAGNMAPIIFALALLFVYLFLSAQYESWTMPLMVMLAVPLAIFGAIGAQYLRGLDNDVYCQIGMVMLIGLASKNAILIVEFADSLRKQGRSIVDAAIEAAHLRLRPILMTALAFILGVLPLVLATGAGAASRRSLGTAVCGGMLVSTFLSLVVVPILYVVIQKMREKVNPNLSPEVAPKVESIDVTAQFVQEPEQAIAAEEGSKVEKDDMSRQGKE